MEQDMQSRSSRWDKNAFNSIKNYDLGTKPT